MTDYRREFIKRKKWGVLKDMDSKLEKFIIQKAHGSLHNRDRKSFYKETVFQDDYKDPGIQKVEKFKGYQNIGKYPMLIKESEYGKKFTDYSFWKDEVYRENKIHSFGLKTRGHSHYKTNYL